jgi:DEAD/DEAH box helicase domain-containing protein
LSYETTNRALLPEIITFAYIPRSMIQINNSSSSKEIAADAFAPTPVYTEEEEHVLVLEMAEKSRGKKSQNP